MRAEPVSWVAKRLRGSPGACYPLSLPSAGRGLCDCKVFSTRIADLLTHNKFSRRVAMASRSISASIASARRRTSSRKSRSSTAARSMPLRVGGIWPRRLSRAISAVSGPAVPISVPLLSWMRRSSGAGGSVGAGPACRRAQGQYRCPRRYPHERDLGRGLSAALGRTDCAFRGKSHASGCRGFSRAYGARADPNGDRAVCLARRHRALDQLRSGQSTGASVLVPDAA